MVLFQILRYLPLIEISSTKRVINFLKKFPTCSDEISTYINYFINTYTKKFQIEDWNISGKILSHRATNNSNESFNKKLNSKLSKSPSIVNFIKEIIK